MRRWLLGLMVLLFAACSGTATEEPVDPFQLITDAAKNIRESNTFRMSVDRTGASYFVQTDLGLVDFRHAMAQYVAPDILQATVRLIAAGLPADVEVFSRGDNQWYRHAVLTANLWFNAPFAEGFNPEELIAQDTGFQMALHSLINLSYEGRDNLEDGTSVFHLKGLADGADISALLANLVETTGQVFVDVFIDQKMMIPVRFVIVQPDTITEAEPEPTTWTVDVYDINAAPELDPPPDES
ncbi:MAG: LppX_LprAFG lipoprotein [Anaerolineae bacterium]|nr:LppX_LprAFG lipoprotein [Anaerolineae bacterium]